MKQGSLCSHTTEAGISIGVRGWSRVTEGRCTGQDLDPDFHFRKPSPIGSEKGDGLLQKQTEMKKHWGRSLKAEKTRNQSGRDGAQGY